MKAAIRLRLRTTGEAPFAKLALERLPLFLWPAPEGARVRLYEQLIANVTAVYVRPTRTAAALAGTAAGRRGARARLRAGGGAAAARAAIVRRLPAAAGILRHAGAVPVRRARRARSPGRPLRRQGAGDHPAADPQRAGARQRVRSRSVRAVLHAGDQPVPQAQRPHQPLRAARPSYHVVPDRMRPLDFEVFSVTAVEGYAADGSAPQPFLPFYAANDLSRNAGAPGLLHAAPRAAAALVARPPARTALELSRPRGVHLAGRSRSRRPYPPGLRQLGLDLLCTNRDLPLSMPVGKQHTDFTIAVSAPVASIRCLVGPVAPRPCRSDGEYAWRFISHLGLNYLSLVDTDALHRAPRRCASCCGCMCRRRPRWRRGSSRG